MSKTFNHFIHFYKTKFCVYTKKYVISPKICLIIYICALTFYLANLVFSAKVFLLSFFSNNILKSILFYIKQSKFTEMPYQTRKLGIYEPGFYSKLNNPRIKILKTTSNQKKNQRGRLKHHINIISCRTSKFQVLYD